MSGIDSKTVSLLHLSDAPVPLDDSGKVWSAVGSPTLDYNIKKIGNNSLYLNGSSYFTTPLTGDLNLETSDFTVDFWIYPTVSGSANGPIIFSNTTVGLYHGTTIYYMGTTISLSISTNGTSWTTASNTIVLNKWNHIACVKNGSLLSVAVNGVFGAIATLVGTPVVSTAATAFIGNMTVGTGRFYIGYIDEIRISNIARWATNFTPQSTPYVIDQYTKVLMHMDSQSYKDETGKIWSGVCIPQSSVIQSKFGGKSLYFNGTNQYLSTPANDDFNLGAGDFTIDWWEYSSGVDGGNLICNASNRGSSLGYVVGVSSASGMCFFLSSNGTSWDIANAATMGSMILNTWTHYALIRNGTSIKAYQNGVLKNTITTSAAIFNSNYPSIGAINSSTGFQYFCNRYINEIRISKGIARWSAPFTPPTLQYSKVRFLAKTLDNHYHAYINKTWLDLGIVSNSANLKNLFLNNEVLDPADRVSLNLLSTTEVAKECAYQENINEPVLITQSIAIPKSQFIHEINDIDLKSISYIDWVKVNNGDTGFETGAGKVRMVASIDSGATWWSYDAVASSWNKLIDTALPTDGSYTGNRFIPTDSGMAKILNSGMSQAVFNAVDWNSWTIGSGYKTLRIGYGLSVDSSSDIAMSDNLSYQYDGVGDWMIATANIHYEVRTKNSSHTITWLDKIGGTRVKINY